MVDNGLNSVTYHQQAPTRLLDVAIPAHGIGGGEATPPSLAVGERKAEVEAGGWEGGLGLAWLGKERLSAW